MREVVLEPQHDAGHKKRDVMPSGDTIEDTQQLNRTSALFVFGV